MNTALEHFERQEEYNNTSLHLFDLASGLEKTEHLGPFWVRTLEMSRDGAVLRGEWRLLFGPLGFDEGAYHITWSPWRIEKVVAPRANPTFSPEK
jgi:hypothetical protein